MKISGSGRPRLLACRLPAWTVCAAIGVCAAAAAQASAAVIAVAEKCVVNVNPGKGAAMIVLGAGFRPGDSVVLSTSAGGGHGTATASVAGTFSAVIAGPILATSGPGVASFALHATVETNGGATADTSFEVANLSVATNPATAKLTQKVRYSFSGFKPGREIYAHYVHKHKVGATVELTRAQGPCGTATARAKLFPGRQRYDRYTVQFDDSKKYVKTSLPRFVTTISRQLF